MFLNMSLLWITWFSMCESDPFSFSLPAPVRYSGMALFVVGLLLFVLTLIKLKTLENYTGELVQDGIFSKIRHPMYLGFVFWIIGYAVFMQAGLSLLSALLWIANILFWCHMEERQLARRYSHYSAYKKKRCFDTIVV
jgi:protein-S-isoprenylcysteine O-methyltransferase Ste14